MIEKNIEEEYNQVCDVQVGLEKYMVRVVNNYIIKETEGKVLQESANGKIKFIGRILQG